MLKHPDTESAPLSSGKLVIPALPGEEQFVSSDQHRAQINPGQLIRQKTPPAPEKLLPKLAWYWRKDPAYKVFMIAMVMVILAGTVFISLASASLFGLSLSGVSYPQNPPTHSTSGGAVDLKPTFSKPTGGTGTNQSSQPPAQNTPSLSPTATGTGGPLTIQIMKYTTPVRNGGRATVVVSTNQPGITVNLQVHYSAQAFGSRPLPQITDSNGNATFSWIIYIYVYGRKNAQAAVMAIATDQNGQSVRSNTVVIQITNFLLPGG